MMSKSVSEWNLTQARLTQRGLVTHKCDDELGDQLFVLFPDNQISQNKN